MHHLDWYTKQQEKKKQSMEDDQISLINHQLADLIKRLPGSIDKGKYDEITQPAGRHLVQCSLWNLSYRNNFENPQVAIAQALLLIKVAKEEKLDNQRYIVDSVERFMRQLGNIDWSMYGTFNRMKAML